jgi:hypothetical protein
MRKKATKKRIKFCYKVVNENLKSLGMKPNGHQVSIVQYRLNEWTYPLESISRNPNKGGGLWVNPKFRQRSKISEVCAKKIRSERQNFFMPHW